jgi:hypothetical protein
VTAMTFFKSSVTNTWRSMYSMVIRSDDKFTHLLYSRRVSFIYYRVSIMSDNFCVRLFILFHSVSRESEVSNHLTDDYFSVNPRVRVFF